MDEAAAEIAELRARLAERAGELAAARAELTGARILIEQYKAQLAKLRRMQFGRSSEKLDSQIVQLELKLEDLEEGEAARTAPSLTEDKGDAPERRLKEDLNVPVLQPEELLQLRAATARVRVGEAICKYIVSLARQTRQHPAVWVGAGPRATLALISASRALAALEERDFVLPEDIKTLAAPVLEHRMVLRPEYEMEGLEIREVINAVLESVEVPR